MSLQSIEVRFLNHARRRKEWNRFGSHIKPGFLSTRATKAVWKGICRVFEKDESGKVSLVSLKYLQEFAETHYPRDLQNIKQVLLRMKAQPYHEQDQTIVEFIQKGITEEAINEGINCLSDPDGLQNLPVVRDMFDAAVQLGSKAKEFYDYFQQAKGREGAIRTNLVPSGVSPRLDREAFEGGIAEGELFILIGPTGRGKTEALCNLAANAIRAGKNVLYCTLQDESDVRIARLVDQVLLGWSKTRITENPGEFRQAIQEARKTCGALVIKDFVQQSVSVFDIRATVEFLIENEKTNIDLLIIDYLDSMVSHTKDKDDNVVFNKIGHALRRLGRNRHFGVWTACQGNRESLDVDDVKLSHIAGAIAKTRAADLVIGMSQKPSEKDEGFMRWAVLKTRITDNLPIITIFKNKSTRRYGERRERKSKKKAGKSEAAARVPVRGRKAEGAR